MKQHIHFIGIGGIGVSGIAQLALKRGDEVSGSDIRTSSITHKLTSLGAKVYVGHSAENINGADLVVYSSAIHQDNPELMAAKAKGIPTVRRAEFLSELMADKKVITVTGAHGKTTTSSLIAKLLIDSGFHPTVAVGGILREDGDNAKLGESSYFIAEADESDGSFLCYTPTYSIITNIDYEHMDFYQTYENLLESFSQFIRQTKEDGCVIYFLEDAHLKSLICQSRTKSISFGFSRSADIYAENITLTHCGLSFICMYRRRALGEIVLRLMGRHNVLNALGVVSLGMELGIHFEKIKAALSAFKGVERRFQVKFESKNLFIVDDYAHHPTEIAATIEAAKACRRKRLIVVFQPHRYTRTKLLMDRFAQSFLASDYLIVTDIYGAGEVPLEGVTTPHLISRIKQQTRFPVDYVAKDKIVEALKGIICENDLVLFLGAGDITKISDEFVKNFQK